MLTIKNFISAGGALFLALAPLHAQGWQSPERPVHSLELMDGIAFCGYKIDGASTSSLGAASGNSFAFRYNCFFPNNFGVFAQIGMDVVSGYERGFFGTMNKADGGKYVYRFNDNDCGFELNPIVTAGVAYNFDCGALSIVPRAGIGYCDQYFREFSYERRGRDGRTGPEYYSVRKIMNGTGVDYLMEGEDYYDNTPVFALSADLQVSYMLSRNLYFFVQPGVNWTPSGFQIERKYVGSRQKYDPTNWVEAVSYADAKDQWMKDETTRTSETFDAHIPPVFHVNFGIGFKFGHRNR